MTLVFVFVHGLLITMQCSDTYGLAMHAYCGDHIPSAAYTDGGSNKIAYLTTTRAIIGHMGHAIDAAHMDRGASLFTISLKLTDLLKIGLDVSLVLQM